MKERIILTVSAVVRILLTITLLVFVWTNVHWSVALLLTLASIRFEIQDLPPLIAKWKYRETTDFISKLIGNDYNDRKKKIIKIMEKMNGGQKEED